MEITQTKKQNGFWKFIKHANFCGKHIFNYFFPKFVFKFASYKYFEFRPWKWELTSEIDRNNSLLQHSEAFSTILPSFRFLPVLAWELQQQTITQKMADQEWFDFYVVFTMSLCTLSL